MHANLDLVYAFSCEKKLKTPRITIISARHATESNCFDIVLKDVGIFPFNCHKNTTVFEVYNTISF